MITITGEDSRDNNNFIMKERDEIELRRKLKIIFTEFKINKEPIIDPTIIGAVSTDIIRIIEEYISIKYVK